MKKFNTGGITAIDVYGDPASTGADPFRGSIPTPDVYIGDAAGLPLTQAEEEANLRAELAAKKEKEQQLIADIIEAQADLDSAIQNQPPNMKGGTGIRLPDDPPGPAESYFNAISAKRNALRDLTQEARDAGLKVPGTGLLDSVGATLSRASAFLGVPLPDFVVMGPNGATVTFGTPTGTPVGGGVVPKTAGSTYTGGPMRAGVFTGVPAIDFVLSQGYLEGDSRFGLPTFEDITDILTETGGVPGVLTDTTKRITPDDDDDDETKVVLGDNSTTNVDDKTTNVDDKTTNVDEIITTIVDETPKVDDKTTNVDEIITTIVDETPKVDPEPDLNDDEEEEEKKTPTGGGGGGGAGYQQGVGITTGAPRDVVDLDYLYDISGSSIFAPRMEEETENGSTPYVYAKSGGMIHNNYDLTDEILRRLIRGR